MLITTVLIKRFDEMDISLYCLEMHFIIFSIIHTKIDTHIRWLIHIYLSISRHCAISRHPTRDLKRTVCVSPFRWVLISYVAKWYLKGSWFFCMHFSAHKLSHERFAGLHNVQKRFYTLAAGATFVSAIDVFVWFIICN